jgi:hypothetical protein
MLPLKAAAVAAFVAAACVFSAAVVPGPFVGPVAVEFGVQVLVLGVLLVVF